MPSHGPSNSFPKFPRNILNPSLNSNTPLNLCLQHSLSSLQIIWSHFLTASSVPNKCVNSLRVKVSYSSIQALQAECKVNGRSQILCLLMEAQAKCPQASKVPSNSEEQNKIWAQEEMRYWQQCKWVIRLSKSSMEMKQEQAGVRILLQWKSWQP